MIEVNIESCCDDLNFVLNNIFNFIIVNPSSKNDVLNKIKSGELKIASDLKPFVLKRLGLKSGNQATPRRIEGEKLHKYLISILSFQDFKNISFPNYSVNNLNVLLDFVKNNGLPLLKFNEKKLFLHQCQLGHLLNRMFYLHKQHKNDIKVPFYRYLEKNVGISRSYAGKLRLVGAMWFEFKGICNLAISFNEFYNRRNEIELLLKNYPNIGTYWKNCEDSEFASEFYLDIPDLNTV